MRDVGRPRASSRAARRTIYTDNFGNTTIRTPGQPTTRGYTDDYGNTTLRTPGQPTVHCYSDAYGNTTCR